MVLMCTFSVHLNYTTKISNVNTFLKNFLKIFLVFLEVVRLCEQSFLTAIDVAVYFFDARQKTKEKSGQLLGADR